VTTTFPVAAPLGTGTLMLLALQILGVAATPLKVTELRPWVAPKPLPVMVTAVPAGPFSGDMLAISGPTVKFTPLLACPPTVTTIWPVVAALGTVTAMLLALQLLAVAAAPLKVTVLVPCVAPKLLPEMLTVAPTTPDVGNKLVICGGLGETVKAIPLLACPPTVTTMLPVVAPLGTGAVILLALQILGVATTPLKVTVLVPCVAPNPVPVMVTEVPTRPEVGDTLVKAGADDGVTLNVTALLAFPATVTTTLTFPAAT